jgi:hypothetical protein
MLSKVLLLIRYVKWKQHPDWLVIQEQHLLHAQQIFLGVDTGGRRFVYGFYKNSLAVP